MTSLLDAAADLLLGDGCRGCARPGRAACRACLATLIDEPATPVTFHVEGGISGVAAAVYDGVTRRFLIAHKEHGVRVLARPLGQLLSLSLALSLASSLPDVGRAQPVALVGPATNPATVRARGQDPLARIAAVASRLLRSRGIAVHTVRGVRLTRRVADQAGLSGADRALNLRGGFELRPLARARLMGLPVVLVDDIVTTGATLDELARALAAGGVRVVGAAVVAATPRRPAGHRATD